MTDEDLYLAAFSDDDHRCLALLLDGAPAAAADAEIALSAPVSGADVEGVRLLLDAGADPRRYAEEPGQPTSAVYAAVAAGCPAELIALLIDHGADPVLPGPNGLLPSWLAAARGRTDLAGLLGVLGGDAAAADGVPDTARLAGACLRADVRALIEAGASTETISLAPDDPKPPSAEVADLLRGYGVGGTA